MVAKKKRGLGRGLDALLGTGVSAAPAGIDDDNELKTLPVDLIQRGKYQPRVDMKQETLQELADSIKAQGVIQPIVVRPLESTDSYEIIAGERRWRATQLAGLHEIPAVIRRVTDKAAMSIALIENIQREELNPLEEAAALERLINEFEMTHQEVADAVGRSRAAVSNLLRLLDLGVDVKRMLEAGDIEMGHARALLALQGKPQKAAAQRVAERGLSVRETEHLVRSLLKAEDKPDPAKRPADPDILRLQEELSGKLGANVSVQHGNKGKGRLVIHYNSLDELDGILNHFS